MFYALQSFIGLLNMPLHAKAHSRTYKNTFTLLFKIKITLIIIILLTMATFCKLTKQSEIAQSSLGCKKDNGYRKIAL